MLKMKELLSNAAKTSKATPLAKRIGWISGNYADRQRIKREDEINAAFCEREAQFEAERNRDMEAAWNEHFCERRQMELAEPVFLGM